MARKAMVWGVVVVAMMLFLSKRPASAAQGGSERRTNSKWAFLVGIDRYADDRIEPLRGAVNDVQELAETLVKQAGFPRDQIVLLTTRAESGKPPTRANVLAGLFDVARKIPPDALVVVAFAGHGMEREGQTYFLPSDAAYADDPRLLQETALNVETVRDIVLNSAARNVVFFFDACRNDPASSTAPTTVAFGGSNRAVRGPVRSGRTVATVFAASGGERAYEIASDTGFGGYFLKAVAEGLRGAAANGGAVTVRGLVSYLESVVPRRVRRDLGEPYSQKPFVKIEGESDFELVEAKDTASISTGRASAMPVAEISYSDVDTFRRPDPTPTKADLLPGRTLLLTTVDVPSGRYALVSGGKPIQSGSFINGEFRLPLRPGRFQLTVSAPNRKEYVEDITLRPRQSIFFVRASLGPMFGGISITSVGLRAEIRLDDRIAEAQRDDSGAVAIRDIFPGTHRLTISHPDKEPWSADIEVRAGKIAGLTPTFRPALGKVVVKGLADSEIRVDGVVVGRIPISGVLTLDGLPVGERVILASKRKFLPVEQTVQVRRGENGIQLVQKPAVAAVGVSEFFQNGKADWDAPVDWQFKPGILTVQGTGVGFLRSKEFADFSMSFLAEPVNGRGIVWVLRADDEGRGHYLFQLIGPTGGMAGRFNTYIVRNGATTLVRSEPLDASIPRNGPLNVDIEARGGTIRHFLSVAGGKTAHAPIGTFEDGSFVLGRIGFGTLNGEVFRVRFLSVKPKE